MQVHEVMHFIYTIHVEDVMRVCPVPLVDWSRQPAAHDVPSYWGHSPPFVQASPSSDAGWPHAHLAQAAAEGHTVTPSHK